MGETNTSLRQKKSKKRAEVPWTSLQDGYGTFRENTAKFTQWKCGAASHGSVDVTHSGWLRPPAPGTVQGQEIKASHKMCHHFPILSGDRSNLAWSHDAHFVPDSNTPLGWGVSVLGGSISHEVQSYPRWKVATVIRTRYILRRGGEQVI